VDRRSQKTPRLTRRLARVDAKVDERVDAGVDAGAIAPYVDATAYAHRYLKRRDDVAFYAALAGGFRGHCLEYGIGNGRIAIPIARIGLGVVGIDRSREMLSDLRRRLAHEPPEVRARVVSTRGDMRTWRAGRTFDLIVCPFNAALHLYTVDDVRAFLSRVRDHLSPRGRFVCDLSVPSLVDLRRVPERPIRLAPWRDAATGERMAGHERYDYDSRRQILYMTTETWPVRRPNDITQVPLTHRQFFPQEWAAHLRFAGLEVERVTGSFDGAPLDNDSDVMIWQAKRGQAR
jgi:SAM-dependent methyltransferase